MKIDCSVERTLFSRLLIDYFYSPVLGKSFIDSPTECDMLASKTKWRNRCTKTLGTD